MLSNTKRNRTILLELDMVEFEKDIGIFTKIADNYDYTPDRDSIALSRETLRDEFLNQYIVSKYDLRSVIRYAKVTHCSLKDVEWAIRHTRVDRMESVANTLSEFNIINERKTLDIGFAYATQNESQKLCEKNGGRYQSSNGLCHYLGEHEDVVVIFPKNGKLFFILPETMFHTFREHARHTRILSACSDLEDITLFADDKEKVANCLKAYYKYSIARTGGISYDEVVQHVETDDVITEELIKELRQAGCTLGDEDWEEYWQREDQLSDEDNKIGSFSELGWRNKKRTYIAEKDYYEGVDEKYVAIGKESEHGTEYRFYKKKETKSEKDEDADRWSW